MKIVEFIRAMLAAGLPIDHCLTAAEELEDANEKARGNNQSVGAKRQARYRSRKRAQVAVEEAEESVTRDVTGVTSVTDVTIVTLVPPQVPPEVSPKDNNQTPFLPPSSPPSRPSIAGAKPVENPVEAEVRNLPAAQPETRDRSRGSRLPENWTPSESDRQFAKSRLPSNAACHEELAKFKEFWLAKAGADARKIDWSLTWKSWIRRASERINEKSARVVPFANPFGTRNGKISISQEGERRVRALEEARAAREDLFGRDGDEVRDVALQRIPAN